MNECIECPRKQCVNTDIYPGVGREEKTSDRTILREEPINKCVAHGLHAENLPRVWQVHEREAK